MARYLMSVIDDATGTATAAEIASIDEYNDRLVAADQWVLAGGLAAPWASTVVDATGDGPPLRTDGPFLETTEYVAGFWVVEAADHATALGLATDASRACGRRVELRPFL
ncbi:YciI family protein [Cellulomonas wangsupingiae]|uniref:YciI family protein n=1 Tax=Cellulomonas wangsupingiae TaxID=2968085 RepID=A0ABY5K6L9_9CELL|nr:YciI family protein [Cellulomonas wangsupingiae]MCC2334933.1 YciI family protein [Cellulomonas wangsupingiae]UUI65433.1 YciI family protein [Cellulomonas wangsupingiae]